MATTTEAVEKTLEVAEVPILAVVEETGMVGTVVDGVFEVAVVEEVTEVMGAVADGVLVVFEEVARVVG